MGTNNAFVVHPDMKHTPIARPAEMMLGEACMLVEAIGLDVVMSETVKISQPRAGSFLGKGYAEQLAEMAEAYDQPLIVINTTLSSVQQRNLETLTLCKVIDRTALILEIFGARAQTHAGRLQVELAALTFQRSRLVRSWTHLERQRGGGGFLGGPGERQIELDRRMLMDRVMRIKAELRDVERTRHLQRRNRDRSETLTLALIGYTNAGKSTLFNKLTGADILSKDMLFATLDPTIRGVDLPSGRRVVMADTVGFISQLPTELVEAFKSTLEEVVEADILVHVHDASSPMVAEEYTDVCQVLEELGIDAEMQAQRVVHILNKSDKLEDMDEDTGCQNRAYFQNLLGNSVFVSARTGAGIDEALRVFDEKVNVGDIHFVIALAPGDGYPRAWLHAHGTVHNSSFDEVGNETLSVSISHANHARFVARWPLL